MNLLISQTYNPYLNLATEEYLLNSNNYSTPIVFLWQNDNTIVVGRNQNALAEINLSAAEADHVNVVRRNTGGGTVFHDLGNLCFSLIATKQSGVNMDPSIIFKNCLQPVLDLLKAEGLPAKFHGRNDLEINGAKISGNAQLQTDTKTLAHGTLLYDVDLKRLAKYLTPNPLKLASKKVKSVQSRVTNILPFLKKPRPIKTFIAKLADSYAKDHETRFITLDKDDWKAINQLAKTKFQTWEWNFGKNQSFKIKKERYWPEVGLVQALFTAEDGRITDLTFEGDFLGVQDAQLITKLLVGHQFRPEILNQVSEADLQSVFGDQMSHDKFRSLLFQ